MSDIRLKTITIENNNNLTIQKGIVNITNTSISSNILNGALVIDGGIGINCNNDAISSTSGGAISIGGGMSVYKQAFFGNNMTLDNNSGVFSINGITQPRFFIDTTTNKNSYISPDGINKRFDLYDTYLQINITKGSTNSSTGSFVVNGGISINNTLNSISSSNGGALTISGGMGILGDSYLSKVNVSEISVNYNNTNNQIILRNNTGGSSSLNMINSILNISNSSDILFNTTTTGNFVFSNNNTILLNINQNYFNFQKYLIISDTIESSNSSTGSLIVFGGTSINCSTDATSSTSGGAFSINGGASIKRKMFTGDSIGIELLNSNKNNKLMLYQNGGDLLQNNLFTGFGINGNGDLRFQLNSNTSDYIFYSSLTSGNSSSEVFRIKGTSEIQFIGNSQRYSIKAGGNTSNDISFQSQNISTDSSVCFFTTDGDLNDSNDLKIFGLGTPNNVVNSEYMKLGWEKNTQNYLISTNKTGTGNNSSIVLQTNNNTDQLTLLTDGAISMSSNINSLNSTIGALVLLNGGLSINSTTEAVSLTNGGAFTLNGGMSVKKSIYIGNILNINSIKMYSANTAGDLITSNPTGIFSLSANDTNTTIPITLSLYSLNNVTQGNYNLLNISNYGNIYNINSNAGGTSTLNPIKINVGNNNQLFLATNGNIGINTTIPNYQLSINGSFSSNNYNYLNQLTVYNNTEATSQDSSGSLSVLGGTSISKNLIVGGLVTLNNTMESSSTSAALYVSGGLTIASGQSSNYGYGALTINGGASVAGELYIGQNLNVTGSINGSASSSSTYAYLTLTATDESINLSTGSLITFGGITIQSYTNSTNVSNGGSLLTAGGASIGKDLFIGGNVYNYGISNFYKNSNNLINFYDNSNIIRFSIDRDTTFNDFSISRYNSIGVFVEKSINIANSNGIITLQNNIPSTSNNSASIILNGGISINTTVNANSLTNGGGLTVAGGTSISKNLFVGGISVFSNTTQSVDVSTGSVIMYGGVGISGNLNVLGDTIINGGLTVVGATTSVESANTLLKDNIFVLNSGPAGSKDSGILIQRFQNDNDTNTGDVISDTPYYTNILPNQSGLTISQVKLNTNANSSDDYYTGWWIKITSGFSSNQIRKIIGYIGSTRIATLSSPFTTQNPSIGDSISLYNKPFVGIIFNEVNNRFEFGSSVQDPGATNISFTDTLPIYFSSATSVSTQESTSITTGAIVLTGGLSISNTTDASSLTSGNALTIGGGASILKSLYVGTDIHINGVTITPNSSDIISTRTFNASNNTSNGTITGLLFNNAVWGFDVYLSIRLTATTNNYSNYHIRGVNKDSSWEIIQSYVGDSIVTFSITNSGQLQYTSSNYPGFVSLTFKFKCMTN